MIEAVQNSAPQPTLLVDADDTLWENIVVFNEVNRRYVDWLLPGRSVAEMQSELDALQVECIAEFGYGRNTFQRSLAKGIERFTDRPVTDTDLDHIAQLVQPLQWDTLDLLDGVVETLEILATRTHLLMVTKGNHDEQQHKVERSGLAHLFAVVEILENKAVDEYAAIVDRHDLDPAHTWMVGNSPRSDVAPALDVGLGAVFIPHAETWSHEQADVDDHPRLLRMDTFRELTLEF